MNRFFNKVRHIGTLHIKAIAAIALLAVVLGFVVNGMIPQQKQYILEGKTSTIFPQENVQYSRATYENGWYSINGSDPGMVIDTSEIGPIRTVLFTLFEPIDEPLLSQLFYHNGSDGYPYSEEYSVFPNMMPGETQMIAQIPFGNYPTLRIDIDMNLPIQSIVVTDGDYTVQNAEKKEINFLPIQILLLFVLLNIVYFTGQSLKGHVQIRTVVSAIIALSGAGVCSIAMYYVLYEFGFPASQGVKIFCVIASLTAALWIMLKNALKENLEIVFLLIALAVGLMYVWGMPSGPINSWDERYHMDSMMDAINMFKRPKAFSVKEIWAIPGSILAQMTIIFRGNYDTMLRMGKLGNLLMYAFVGYAAIRRLRSGKVILAVLLLAPTNLFLASSFSYDPWVTAWTALGLAYYFAEWQEADRPLLAKNALIMVGAICIGCIPKQIYFALLFVLLWMPEGKFSCKKERNQYWLLLMIGALVLLASFIVPFFMNMESRTDLRGGSDVDAIRQVQFILTHPLSYTSILLRFLYHYISPANIQGTITRIGYLGSVSGYELYLVALCMAAMLDRSECDHMICRKRWIKVYDHILFFGTLCLVATALYVSFTPVALDNINGCQARYIMPILFPAIYLLGSEKIHNDMNRSLFHGIILLICGYVAFGAVLQSVMSIL